MVGALRNGLSREEIAEVLLHSAVYCGAPGGQLGLSGGAVGLGPLRGKLTAEPPQPTMRVTKAATAKFAPHCGSCPLRARCTKAKARSFNVTEHDEELVEARTAWRDDEIRETYRTHRPMVERSISRLVAKGNRRLRYRGVERNEAWAHRRVAALNLRKLVVLGLTRQDGNWVLQPT